VAYVAKAEEEKGQHHKIGNTSILFGNLPSALPHEDNDPPDSNQVHYVK
jgi:hypothetical protein